MKTGLKVLSTAAFIAGATVAAGGVQQASAETFTESYQDFRYRVEEIGNEAEVEAVAYEGGAAEVTVPYEITIRGKVYKVTGVGLEGNTSITKLNISEGITYLEDTAFKGCTNLKEVNLPATLETVDTAFVDSSVQTINVAPGSSYFASVDGNLYKADKGTLVVYAPGKTETAFTVPEGTQNLYSNAFDSCKNLQSVTLPSSMEIINADAFMDCPSLSSVQIPEGVEEIRRNAFSGCTSLKTITLPGTLTAVSSEAFADSVENINVAKSNKSYSSVKGNLYDKKQTKLLRYAPGKKAASFVLPETVKSVVDVSFKNAKKLKSVIVLNKNCKLGDKNTISKSTTIYGYKNSVAAKYAKKAKKKFKAFNTPAAVKVGDVIGKSKSVTVKWDKASKNVKGYTVQCSTSKKFTDKTTKTVTVKSPKKVLAKVKGLKKNKTYYVRVSGYNTVKVAGNKLTVIGDASKTVSVKVK